jgi:hypothetical protein
MPEVHLETPLKAVRIRLIVRDRAYTGNNDAGLRERRSLLDGRLPCKRRSKAMPPRRRPPLRSATAARLRSLADRFERPLPVRTQPSAAPLVRFGGRWWARDEIIGEREPAPPQ